MGVVTRGFPVPPIAVLFNFPQKQGGTRNDREKR